MQLGLVVRTVTCLGITSIPVQLTVYDPKPNQ